MNGSALLLGSLMMAFGDGAQAGTDSREMRWLGIDFAPMTIVAGPDAGTGYLDEVLRTIQPLFPGVKHSILYGNSSRLEQLMQRGGNICTIAMLHTRARERYMVYSKPFARIIPNGIITLKTLEQRLEAFRDQHGNVSLARAGSDRTLRLGLSQGRVYGDQIDDVIRPWVGPPLARHVEMLASTNIGEGLYRMLQRGRVDYMLGYPLEERYFLQRYTDVNSPTVFIPIAESSKLIDRHLACVNTPWGRQRVAEMNRLLESKELRQKLQGIYESRLSPDARVLYRMWLERK